MIQTGRNLTANDTTYNYTGQFNIKHKFHEISDFTSCILLSSLRARGDSCAQGHSLALPLPRPLHVLPSLCLFNLLPLCKVFLYNFQTWVSHPSLNNNKTCIVFFPFTVKLLRRQILTHCLNLITFLPLYNSSKSGFCHHHLTKTILKEVTLANRIIDLNSLPHLVSMPFAM